MYADLARAACQSIKDSSLEIIPLPKEKDVKEATVSDAPSPAWPLAESDIAYLHHTSGTSTGLPKPIPQAHRAAIGVLPTFHSGFDKATFTMTPLYHGGVADCFRAWTSGAMIWLFPGADVPITPTNILRTLDCARRSADTHQAPRVRYFSSVPYVLQMLAAEDEGLDTLRQMELVGVGGAALPQDVGDDLVEKGVNLVSRFGSAECGFLMSSHRDYATDKEWQYLRSNASPHLEFEPQEDGLAELVILRSWPHMAKRNRDDGSYATADLFAPHPTIPQAWKYHSRADSQLTLITGKKFDPAPLEDAISTSPLLSDVLIFGNSQQFPGALLFRATKSSGMTDEELLSALWPSIERLNAESQGHTRLSKSMLTVMPSDAPGLEKSSKGTIMRGQAEKSYSLDIEQAYNSDPDTSNNHVLSSSQDEVPDDEVTTAVVQIIQRVLDTSTPIPEEGDLFSLGVDSVHCMRIRALLQHRILPASAAQLPLNVIYDCGTIKRLSKYLISIRKGQKVETEDETQLMRDLVQEYSNFTDDPRNSLDPAPSITTNITTSSGQVVILTGATGALGAHILSLLRSSSHVSEIHCLIRAASPTAANERISKSLLARNKAPLDITSSKITCHPCRLYDPALGLIPSTYKDLATRTTVVIHAAWAVNFSMRLSSFVKDHIAGLRNLINFALTRPKTEPPPRFLFCSSTASVLGPHHTSPIPERISHDPSSASPLGYSRSKWVAESICEQAHLHTRLKDRIAVLRIGQLCGDTESGIWNVTEAWPLMLSSVKVTGSLPDLPGEKLGWLPVDVAASAVLEISLPAHPSTTVQSSDGDIPVHHLLNPSTQSTWADLLRWLRKLPSPPFALVPPTTWVSQLDALTGDAANHPARKLLGLWKEAYCSDNDDGKSKQEGVSEQETKTQNEKEKEKGKGQEEEVTFSMTETIKVAPAMRDVRPIGEEQIAKIWGWIDREMMGH